jgi:hypothetical protein
MQGFFTSFDKFKENSNFPEKGLRYFLEKEKIINVNNKFNKIINEKNILRITGKANIDLSEVNINKYFNIITSKLGINKQNTIIIFDGDNLSGNKDLTLLIKNFAILNFEVYCVKKYEGEKEKYFSPKFVEGWNKFNINVIILINDKPYEFGIEHQTICVNLGSALSNYAFNEQKLKETKIKLNDYLQDKGEKKLSELTHDDYLEFIQIFNKEFKDDEFNRTFKNNIQYPTTLEEYKKSESGLIIPTGYLELLTLLDKNKNAIILNEQLKKIQKDEILDNKLLIIILKKNNLDLSFLSVNGGKNKKSHKKKSNKRKSNKKIHKRKSNRKISKKRNKK